MTYLLKEFYAGYGKYEFTLFNSKSKTKTKFTSTVNEAIILGRYCNFKNIDVYFAMDNGFINYKLTDLNNF